MSNKTHSLGKGKPLANTVILSLCINLEGWIMQFHFCLWPYKTCLTNVMFGRLLRLWVKWAVTWTMAWGKKGIPHWSSFLLVRPSWKYIRDALPWWMLEGGVIIWAPSWGWLFPSSSIPMLGLDGLGYIPNRWSQGLDSASKSSTDHFHDVSRTG